MAFSPKDVDVLLKLVCVERGDFAMSHVSRYVDQLRRDGDRRSADLWSMVLAELYQQLGNERHADAPADTVEPPAIVLVSPS